MTILEQEKHFLAHPPVPSEAVLLTFQGVDGYDVYNASIPFEFSGTRYIFGRVERHGEWAASHIALFEETERDVFQRVPEFEMMPLEDPFVQWIGGELVLGGTKAVKEGGEVKTYFLEFFRGPDPFHLKPFTTGPDYMKDIRLIELPSGRIGFFSRPRSEEIRAKFGSEAVIGYAEVESLDALTPEAIAAAPAIAGLLGKDEWGGVNQCYLLADGRIGLAAHVATAGEVACNGIRFQHYCNAAFVYDPVSGTTTAPRIIATRGLYPPGEPKLPHLADCAFTSGFVFRPDGLVDVYSGVGDSAEGRITLPRAVLGPEFVL